MDCSNANNALKPFAHLARDTGAIFSFFLCSSQECALLSLRAFLISSFHPIQHKANIITYRWARKNVSWHENERGKANLPWKICWLVGYKTCIMVWPAYYCSANRDTNCGQCKQKSLFTDEALWKKNRALMVWTVELVCRGPLFLLAAGMKEAKIVSSNNLRVYFSVNTVAKKWNGSYYKV